jgi:hypothetical protein
MIDPTILTGYPKAMPTNPTSTKHSCDYLHQAHAQSQPILPVAVQSGEALEIVPSIITTRVSRRYSRD